MAVMRKYYVPELKAREILKFIVENPNSLLVNGGRSKLERMFAEKFQRSERTIRTYIRMILPEAFREIRKALQQRNQELIDKRRNRV